MGSGPSLREPRNDKSLMADPLTSDGAFFGRRKGKSLRPGHERLLEDLLPRLRIELPDGGQPIDAAALFPVPVEAVRLEIGFGGGEHLAATARAAPHLGFIGCEPFLNGIAKLLAIVDAEGLANIRLWDEDATELIERLPPAALDRAYLLFPDPWPKRRQRKRRFVSDESLSALARILQPGADLRFATDIDDYAGWALARVLRSTDWTWAAAHAEDWRRPWPDWPGTRYEAKAAAAGRRSSYLTFRRR